MKYQASLLIACAAAVNIQDFDDYRNAALRFEDGHLQDYNHGAGIGSLRFLDLDYGRNAYLADLKGAGYAYGPVIGQAGATGDVTDDEFRFYDLYSNDDVNPSDDGPDASDSKHTSDSDFTDFSNGTFSNRGYHNHGRGHQLSFDSDIDIYTASDDFELFGFEDGPDGHEFGYFTDNYTDSDSSDGYVNGEKPNGHYGHGHFGRGVDHWHNAAYNGHDYGNPDLLLNGGLYPGGHAGRYGYDLAGQATAHTYDAWRPVHYTFGGLGHYIKPNFQIYDSTARYNIGK